MSFKSIFNIIMYSFFLIVPLVPLKTKVGIFPVSADFIIGGLGILFGGISLIIEYRKNRDSFKILKDKNVKYLSLFIAFFVVLSLVSLIYAKDRTAVVAETMRFLEYVILFYFILIFADERFIKVGLLLFYISMIFVSVYGVYQFTQRTSPYIFGGYKGIGRAYSTFENPNYFGAAINMVIFYPLIRLIEDKGKKKLYNIGVFLLFFINLILSFTRGAWLSFGLGLVFLGIIKYRKFLFAVPVGVATVYAIPFTRGRFLSIFKHSVDDSRIKLWKTGYAMFREHVLTGVGNGNYIKRYKEYIKKYPDLNLGVELVTVHNSYIKMFAELGIFGGVSFILIYFTLFNMCYRAFKRTSKYKVYLIAFLGFWIAYFFQNFFNNLMFIPQLNVFVWIISAMLYKGVYIENMDKISSNKN